MDAFPPIAIYLASILGALALILLMPGHRWSRFRYVGAVLGAATLGGLWLFLSGFLPERLTGMGWEAFAFYYVFSAIAIIAAVRVITHTRPVYSALWFVMVVLASAGMLVVLAAEFMAFAMIIIYAGAIVVTYMFVLMLASQVQPSYSEQAVTAEYDARAREPIAAAAAGFLLLAVLLTVSFEPMASPEAARGLTDEQIATQYLADRPSIALREQLGLTPELAAQSQLSTSLGGQQRVSNTERVGLDLFQSHPLGLELAGVILLVALIGAVVIARTHVEEERTGADERRQA